MNEHRAGVTTRSTAHAKRSVTAPSAPNCAWVTKVHRAIYQKTDGLVGARPAGLPMSLITTVGRKSGLPRTLPLAVSPDGDDPISLASNHGPAPDPPGGAAPQ